MLSLTAIEIVSFCALFAVSLAVTWRRLRRIWRNIVGARKDPEYSIRPLGPRIGRFLSEVVGQAKVIRHRPLPGIAHAVVFWGFCAFALVTLDHLAAAFGLDLIPHESRFGRLYYPLVAVFAAAVGVAIVGLLVRRFVTRPKWLGEVSGESALIDGLIFTLMWTYIAGYVVGESGAAGKAIWWIHTASLAAFLPLIPNTKHLHLALSPIAVFLERGFSRIPPLVGDEDFGLDAGKDVTRLTSLQAYSCVECGRCTEHCPASNTGKELNPKQIILGVRNYLNEFGARGEEPLLGKHLSQKAAFQCTTCGACEYQCPVGIEHLPVLIGLRRGAVNTGKWEDDYGGKLFLNLERFGNPMGFSTSERDKFVQQHGLPVYDGSQEYCLWLGCMGAYDPQGREVTLALVKVLNHLKVSYGVLKREKCTGDAARRLGNDLAFEELATFNLEQFEKSGVRKLLSACPHCVRTIAEDWKQFGESPAIEHHSEFLAARLAGLPESGIGASQVVYHDPCYLGRYRNVYDQPRQVIARWAGVVDPPRARDRAFCCGAGGGLFFLGEEEGKRVNVERAEELASTGAETIGVACPFCRSMFKDGLGSAAGAPKLLDIAQIAATNL
ncbi:MAG: (Fe-S)-binding protein [Bryobacteraceae bacterium]|nr:(Fe-S)-binding protein [Bryobacteraceae bacterium]